MVADVNKVNEVNLVPSMADELSRLRAVVYPAQRGFPVFIQGWLDLGVGDPGGAGDGVDATDAHVAAEDKAKALVGTMAGFEIAHEKEPGTDTL